MMAYETSAAYALPVPPHDNTAQVLLDGSCRERAYTLDLPEPSIVIKRRSDANAKPELREIWIGCCLQRLEVDVEFVGKLVERQQLGLSLVVRDCSSGSLWHR